MRAAFLRLSDRLAAATRVAVTVLMAAMTVDCILGVFFRYVVQDALTWTEESARYLMIWMGFLGMGLAVREGGHVAVDLLVNALPPALRRASLVAAQALVLAFLAAVVVAGWQLVDRVSGQAHAGARREHGVALPGDPRRQPPDGHRGRSRSSCGPRPRPQPDAALITRGTDRLTRC